MLYILYASYKPNQAATNRVLALIKGIDELGIEATFILVYPSAGCNRLDDSVYRNVKVLYLWENRTCHNKYYKYICSFFDARKFAKSLKAGDFVLLFGCSSYAQYFTSMKGVKVFQERTEHPLVNPVDIPWLQRRYLKHISDFDGMFVISTYLKKVMEDYGAKNVHVINMIVDFNRFAGVEKSVKEKYIAYCGTASNNKDGVDDLIKAFAIVARKHPEVKLKIIGKAPTKDDETGNLKLVDDLGIKDNVEFTGVISAQDMPQMLKNATVLALARPDSLQAQCGFPTKLGEYLLSENPIVVTKVGDIPLFLKDGESALLSEERNVEEFASKIIWALEHPEEAEKIGKEGAKVAMKAFNYLTEAKKMIDVIFE